MIRLTNAGAKMRSVAEVAARFAVENETVLGWISSGALRSVNISNGTRSRWRISEEAIEEFIKARTSMGKPAPTTTTRRNRKPNQRPPEIW